MTDFMWHKFYLNKKENGRQIKAEFDSMTWATECEWEEAASGAHTHIHESADWDGNGHYWLVLEYANQNEDCQVL